jgi:RimJ/RimL family protein N-acetyltransferase
MTLDLRPAAGEAEFGDPAFAGDWAAVLPEMLAVEQSPPWCSYAVRSDGALVGLGGFKGPPDADGAVEIAYLTGRPAEGQGIARAVVGELLSVAREAAATAVIAHTLPEHNPSNRALLSNGFALAGEVTDPEDGRVWCWARRAQ